MTGEVTPFAATVFAVVLEAVRLRASSTPRSTRCRRCSRSSATAFYVLVYTMWLKRRSSQNIVIGGAAGAAPVLIGWAAVTGSLSWTPVVLFAIIFIWTPPHFWALAVRYRDDYEAANVPMLPVVASLRSTTLEILVYTVVLWAATVLFGAVGSMGPLYGASAIVLGGAVHLPRRAPLPRRQGRPRERRQGDAALRLLHHLPHAAVRRDGRRCPRPLPLRPREPTDPRAERAAPRHVPVLLARRRDPRRCCSSSRASSRCWARARRRPRAHPCRGSVGLQLHARTFPRLPLVDAPGTLAAPWGHHHGAVLLFFADWCTVCHGEVHRLARELGPDVGTVHVVGFDGDSSSSVAAAFVASNHIRFPVAHDGELEVADALVPAAFPATVFVSATGKVKAVALRRDLEHAAERRALVDRRDLVARPCVDAARRSRVDDRVDATWRRGALRGSLAGRVEPEGQCGDRRGAERPGEQHRELRRARDDAARERASQRVGERGGRAAGARRRPRPPAAWRAGRPCRS